MRCTRQQTTRAQESYSSLFAVYGMHHPQDNTSNVCITMRQRSQLKRCGNVTDESKEQSWKTKEIGPICQTTWSWCIKETRRVSRQTSHQEHNVESRHGSASQDSSRTWSVTCIFRRPSAVYLVSSTGRTAPLRGFRPDPGERLRRADFAASAAALLLI